MDSSPPGSPGSHSINSSNLGAKQYFLVNLSKFIVEMLGTATLGLFYMLIGDQQTGMLLGVWVLSLFGETISGAHYNPAVTLVFMLRKNSPKSFGKNRLKGIIYMVAQIFGGLIAGFLSVIFLSGDNHKKAVQPLGTPDEPRSFEATISEVVASFVFIFLFMLSTDKKTQYSEDRVINCFIIASSYVAARLMGGGKLATCLYTGRSDELYIYVGPLMNPALALG